MKKKGRDLLFISWIKRDGSGTKRVSKSHIETMNEDEFTIHSLSITQNTYIAIGFNSFVVKLKEQTNGKGKH